MTLFDSLDRTPEYEGRLVDAKFEVLSRSGRAMAQRIRVTLDEWFSKFPPDGQNDLRSRFRSNRDSEHLGALLELFTFTALRHQGWRLSQHPQIPAVGSRPDFEASRGWWSRIRRFWMRIADLSSREAGLGVNKFLIECTTTNPDVRQVGADQRIFELVAGLDRIFSDQRMVLYASESVGAASLSQKWLVGEVQSWLKKLDVDEVRLSGDWPKLSLDKDGWKIDLHAIPTKPGVEAAGLGGPYQSEAVDIVPASRIRETIEGKAKGLKGVTRPLLLVVAANIDIVFPDRLFEAVFGDREISVRKGFDQAEVVYSPNGAWREPRGFRGEQVSAILFAPRFDAWQLAKVEWQIIYHPKPDASLGRRLIPFATELSWDDAGKFNELPPISTVREVFQLDSDWPGPDDVQD